MATTQEKWQEIANRGLQDNFDPETRAKFDEAVKRGLIQTQPQGREFNPMKDISGFGITGEDVLGAANLGLNIATDVPSKIVGGGVALKDIIQGEGSQAAETAKEFGEKVKTPLSDEGKEIAVKVGESMKGLLNNPGIAKLVQFGKEGLDGFTKLGEIQGAVLSGDPEAILKVIMNQPQTPGSKAETFVNAGGSVTKALPEAALDVSGFKGSPKGIKPTGKSISPPKTPKIVDGVKQAEASLKGLEQATGKKVGLFGPQQSMKPSELIKQRLLPQLDAGTLKATEALEIQNKEVFDATTKLIQKISPKTSVAGGAERFRKAGEESILASKARRANASSPAFEQAIKEGADVNTGSVKKILNEALFDSVEGSQQSSLRQTLRTLDGPKIDGVQQKPSLRRLDKAKNAINAKLEAKASKAVDRDTQRILLQAKKKLVDNMEKASPEYKKGMDEFRRLSPEVNELETSIIGITSKMEGPKIKNIAQNIFDPKSGLTDPQAIINAKKIIDKTDPGAWDDLLRVELNRRVGGIEQLIEDIPGELVGNVPGQLRRAIFGNASQRNALLVGASKEQRKNLIFLDDVLRRASSGRQAGSPTIPFKETLDKLRGVSLVVRDAIFNPLETLKNTGERALFDKNVSALTDSIFDTRLQRDMTKLRKMNPNSKASEKLFAKILDKAEANKLTLSATAAKEIQQEGEQ